MIIGEKTFKIYTIKTDGSIQLFYDHSSKSLDKIIKIVYDTSSNEMVCLFAHNFVEIYKYDSEKADFEMTDRKFCSEECILYAGDISKQTGTYIVASGTVFRSILIWDLATLNILNRLSGHTGVIFDLRFLK